MSDEVKQVYMRMPDDENDGVGFVKFPACLVHEHLAFVIFDDQLELHIVQPSAEPTEYDLRFASNPLFYVGNNHSEVFDDLRKMNLIEFAKKYRHSDFDFPLENLSQAWEEESR